MATGNTRAEVLDLRLFIEGLEVPVISATATYAIHTPASAFIQVLATDEVLQLKPRSIVEVYYRTQEERSINRVQTLPFYRYNGKDGDEGAILRNFVPAGDLIDTERNEARFEGSGNITAEDAEDELKYDLLFLGELAGYTFYEDSQSRTINLMCVDFSNHLDNLNLFTFNLGNPAEMGILSRQSVGWGVIDPAIKNAVAVGDRTVTTTALTGPDANATNYKRQEKVAESTVEETSVNPDVDQDPLVNAAVEEERARNAPQAEGETTTGTPVETDATPARPPANTPPATPTDTEDEAARKRQEKLKTTKVAIKTKESIDAHAGKDGAPKESAINIIAGGIIGLDQRIAKVLGEYGLKVGIRSIMESISNSYVFYRDVDEEINLRDQIFISEDERIATIFENAAALDVIFGYQNRYGTINSLKNLIKIIFKLPHFDFCPLPGSPFYGSSSFLWTRLR